MNRLQSFLQRACNDLGLRIVIPFELEMSDGTKIQAQALLPQLGSANGIVIVKHYSDLKGAASQLSRMGYSYSVLDEPLSSEEFDLRAFAEMFSDWGWGNVTENRPNWM